MLRQNLAMVALVASVHCLACGDDVGILSIARTSQTGGSDGGTDDSGSDGSDLTPDASLSDDASGDAAGDGNELDSRVEAVEASVVRPDAGVGLPLFDRSPSCLACAEANCANYLTACDTLTGHAEGGDAGGAPKSKLCLDTVSCLLEHDCTATNVSACYCGDATCIGCRIRPLDCTFPDLPNGPCKAILEQSTEATGVYAVTAATSDITKGAAWAVSLLRCLSDNFCSDCFPSAASDAAVADGD